MKQNFLHTIMAGLALLLLTLLVAVNTAPAQAAQAGINWTLETYNSYDLGWKSTTTQWRSYNFEVLPSFFGCEVIP